MASSCRCTIRCLEAQVCRLLNDFLARKICRDLEVAEP